MSYATLGLTWKSVALTRKAERCMELLEEYLILYPAACPELKGGVGR
jgi:hypothetical protein